MADTESLIQEWEASGTTAHRVAAGIARTTASAARYDEPPPNSAICAEYSVSERTASAAKSTRPDGTTIWVTFLILSILVPHGTVRDLTIGGITETGHPAEDEYWEGADDYPQEIAPLIPALINATHTPAPPASPDEQALTPATVTPWASAGKLSSFRTPRRQRSARRRVNHDLRTVRDGVLPGRPAGQPGPGRIPRVHHPQEFAAALRVTKVTVYRMIENRELGGTVRIGTHYRIPQASAQAYMKNHCIDPQEPGPDAK